MDRRVREELVQWYLVRDTFVGLPPIVQQDCAKALELAKTCQHENAKWLSSVFFGISISSVQEARAVLLSRPEPMAVCLAEVVLDESEWDMKKVQAAAESGDAFAEAMMAWNGDGDHKKGFEWAQRAAAKGERDGFFLLGLCFQLGQGTAKDLEKAKESYLKAAELDDVQAMRRYGLLERKNDPNRYAWLGKAACRGESEYFLSTAQAQMLTGSGRCDVQYAIGKALVGQINLEAREIFGKRDDFDQRIQWASRALRFYEEQTAAARVAVDLCTLIGIRGGLVHDVRLIIAKIIWEGRFEANYKSETDFVASPAAKRPPKTLC